MQLFGKALYFGNFRSTDYGLIMVSNESGAGESDDDVYALSTNKTFISDNPVSVYTSMKYDSALEATATFMKSICGVNNKRDSFSEYECRAIVRELTGRRGWDWLRVLPEDEEFTEDIWYRARNKDIKYHRINGDVYTITATFEFDSFLGYSEEKKIDLSLSSSGSKSIYITNDDLNNYLYPVVTITPLSSGTLQITNVTDNNWMSEFTNVTANKSFTVNNESKILSGHSLNDFNLKFIRLLEGKNKYSANMDVKMSFVFREPRKTGLFAR